MGQYITNLVNNKRFVSFALFFLSVSLVFVHPSDPDFGWHYTYGQYAVQNRQLLIKNIYSYPSEGTIWLSFYWISQLYFYVLYSQLPTIVAGLISASLFSVTLIKILDKTKVNLLGKFMAVIIISDVMKEFLVAARPMLFSSILFLILMYILEYKERWVPIVPLLFALWANLHADWMFGLTIFGFYLGNRLWDRMREKTLTVKYFVGTSLFLLIAAAATLINPYGIKLWTALITEGRRASGSIISEWLPPGISMKPGDWGDMAIYIVEVAMGGIILATAFLERKTKKLWYLATIITFFILANRSGYFLRILVLTSGVMMANFWGNFLRTIEKIPINDTVRHAGGLVIKMLTLVIIFSCGENFLLRITEATTLQTWSESRKYPYGAIQIIKSEPERFEGNMFNQYGWGGYIIWQMPEHKTFIDGRFASWGGENDEDVREDYLSTWTSFEDMETVFKKYDIKWILVNPKSKMGINALDNQDKIEIVEQTEDYLLAIVNR
jgi:hypothetical protein